MRFTTYSKYHPELADAVNLQGLLDQLSDFLLQSGFAGGSPSLWHDDMGDGERSLDALRQAILQALMDSGQLTPEMLQVLRGESTGDAERDKEIERQLSELLDKIVQRLIDEGYLNIGQAPQVPQGYQSMFGPERPGQVGGAAGAVQSHREGDRLPRLQDPQGTPGHAWASRASALTTLPTWRPAWKPRE